MPTNLVKIALQAAENIYSSNSLIEFLNRYNNSNYSDLLLSPLLIGNISDTIVVHNLENLDLQRASWVSISNLSRKLVNLSIKVDLIGHEDTVSGLFKRFVKCCSHTNHLGNFRTKSRYYGAVYSGQRYLVSHGDGHCVALGLLFQSLCRRVLSQEITLHYCVSGNREFTHVFGLYEQADGVKLYIDPDQKTFRYMTEISGSAPDGLIFQMLSRAGYWKYERMVANGMDWMFPSMTEDNFATHRSAEMAIYKKSPSLNKMAYYFDLARRHHIEELSINEDDYPWKSDYRKNTKTTESKECFFLTDLETPWLLSIPPGGRLDIGIKDESMAVEIQDLFTVFFGRVPAILWINIKAGETMEVSLPEFPWFITTPNSLSMIHINNQEIILKTSVCGQHRLVGMKVLETVIKISGPNYKIKLAVQVDCSIGIGLPINSFALNSGFARFSAPESDSSDLLILECTPNTCE